jgi:Raf kinase inhibitor-like YbhB/YbcL family protein
MRLSIKMIGLMAGSVALSMAISGCQTMAVSGCQKGEASKAKDQVFTLTSTGFKNKGDLPSQYAYCKPDGKGSVEQSDDISPPLHWAHAPKGTKSFVVLVTDPSIPESANFDVKGKTIAKTVKRMTGYHWVLVDIPSYFNGLPEKAGSDGFVIGGKKPGKTCVGVHGENIYTGVFQSPIASRVEFKKGKNYKGIYGRYDGGCPPWNDEQVHSYVYTVYALDVASLKLNQNGRFTGPEVVKAMKEHVLAQASISAKLITNPAFLKKKSS